MKTLWATVLVAATSVASAQDHVETAEVFSTLQQGSALDQPLTPLQQDRARRFNLTDTDWLKYLEIMEGPRQYWSPNLDPITALGIHEEDPRERRRYADLWVEMESKRYSLELAFETERMAAAKRRFGNLPAIDNTGWKQAWAAAQDDLQKKVMLFMDPDCVDACRSLYEDLYASLGSSPQVRLDIFFLPGTDSSAIGDWAAAMDIDPAIVRERKVTLNYAETQYRAYGIDVQSVPQVRVQDMRSGDVIATFQ